MIFWLAFAALLYEIVLSRVLAYILPYHFTPLALSMAMLGLGLGACLGGRADERPASQAGVLAAVSASFLFFDAMLFAHWALWALVAAALPPLLLLGVLMSRIYGASRSPHRTYLLDMLGAAAACLLALLLLSWLGPMGVTLMLAAVFGAASLAASGGEGRALRGTCAAAAALSAAALCAWSIGLVPDFGAAPRRGAQKPMHEAMLREKGRTADFAWGPAGRADLYEHPAFPNIKWLYNDATNSSYMVREPDTPARQAFLRRLLLNLPFALRRPQRVLLIGPGGGIELHLARLAGVASVDAVEVNGASVDIVRRWAAFTGRVYDAPGVRVHVAEGRRFLASARGRYDLIQLSLAYTATAFSGSFALAEGHLYTVEALSLYLRRLTPTGLLAVLDDSQQRALRTVLTALEAFEAQGTSAASAMDRVAVLGNPGSDQTGYAALVLVSPQALPAALRAELMELCVNGRFLPLWVPGHSEREPFKSLSRDGGARFTSRQALDWRPRTDDRPYFFYFGKGASAHLRTLAPVLLLGGLSGLLALATGLASGLRRPPGERRPAVLAAVCGASFMLLEAGLLNKLMLAIGGPTQVLAALLFSLLFWCGLGSRLAEGLRRRRGFELWMAFAAAGLIPAGCILLMRGAWALEGVSSEALRLLLVFLFLAPVGLSLGGPFPLLLKLQAEASRGSNALLWGINGFASVAGACLSIAISFLCGAEAGLLAGSAGYLVGAWAAVLKPGDAGAIIQG